MPKKLCVPKIKDVLYPYTVYTTHILMTLGGIIISEFGHNIDKNTVNYYIIRTSAISLQFDMRTEAAAVAEVRQPGIIKHKYFTLPASTYYIIFQNEQDHQTGRSIFQNVHPQTMALGQCLCHVKDMSHRKVYVFS